MSTTVFVSGATGFIAQHVIKHLISKGYHVVGSVRSTEKGENLQKLFGANNFTFEIVRDIAQDHAFDAALEKHPEVTVFIHTASPVAYKADDIEKELLSPAVDGTKNALRAIKLHGHNVKKVVVTSSYVAHWTYEKLTDPTQIDTEESWNPITWEESKKDALSGYAGSKKFAEKAAWDFVAEEKPQYTINFVNPVYVFGPQAFDSEVKAELNLSSEIVGGVLKLNADSPVPEASGVYVDVRDVAAAHVAAFERDLPNERLLMHQGYFSGQDILDIVNENFESLRGKLPVGVPGSGDKVTSQIARIDNAKTRKIIGGEFISLKKSVVDTIAQILKARENK